MKLIDKERVVAEIKRLISIANSQYDLVGDEDIRNRILWSQQASICSQILSFIDTLEVKEVDLEKEINDYISNNFFGSQTLGFFANRTKEEPNDQDVALCAKHFFELGLKAKKGE